MRITVWDLSRKVNRLSIVIWDRKIITEFTRSISSTIIGKPVLMMDVKVSKDKSHLIKFVILEDFITPKPLPKTNPCKRNFDKFDNNKLKEDLHKIDWINEILKNNDINEIFDIFYKTLSEIVDRYVRLTKVTKRERTLLSKPWINKEIKHLMLKRNKLFQQYCACKNQT